MFLISQKLTDLHEIYTVGITGRDAELLSSNLKLIQKQGCQKLTKISALNVFQIVVIFKKKIILSKLVILNLLFKTEIGNMKTVLPDFCVISIFRIPYIYPIYMTN